MYIYVYIFYFSFYYSWCDVLQDFINLINVGEDTCNKSVRDSGTLYAMRNAIDAKNVSNDPHNHYLLLLGS